MNRSMIALVAILLLTIPARGVLAGTIKYSWEGTLQPREADVDPWGIGAAGKPFFVSVVVSRDARDGISDVDRASFVAIDAELRIDGTPALLAPGECCAVSLNDRPSTDTIELVFRDVSFNHVTEDFVTLVRLPDSTFTFERSSARPPSFPPTTVTGEGSMVFDSSSYLSRTAAGAAVTGTLIPEPSVDLNSDGFVDFDDLMILLANWNTSFCPGAFHDCPDALFGGKIDFDDLAVLLSNWTGPDPAGSPEAALGEAAVPEPSTLLLALWAIMGAAIAARRIRKR